MLQLCPSLSFDTVMDLLYSNAHLASRRVLGSINFNIISVGVPHVYKSHVIVENDKLP
jgi:hypothetical protein